MGLADLMHPALLDWSSLDAFIGFIIGADFVAAEISSGSMGNRLTSEPRRMRVSASKLSAVGLGLIAATVVISAQYGRMATTWHQVPHPDL